MSDKIKFDNGELNQSLLGYIEEELMKVRYNSKVRTLSDMSPSEIKHLEQLYNAKIVIKKRCFLKDPKSSPKKKGKSNV